MTQESACNILYSGNPSYLSLSPPSPVRALRGAFLKVEDLSRLYRPLVLEMKRWPRPLCHASHKASPFDPPHMAAKSPEQLQQKKEMRGDKVEKRPGHCECCSVKFDDLQMVSNNVNFACHFLKCSPPHSTCEAQNTRSTPAMRRTLHHWTS